MRLMLTVVPGIPLRRFHVLLTPSLWLMAGSLILAGGWQLIPSSAVESDLLHRRIDRVDFDGVPLHEALHRLAASAGISISPDPNNFAGSETWETPVELHLRDVEFGAVFDRLKGHLSYDAVLEQRDGRLYLKDRSALPSVARVYDVSDLIARWSASPYCLQPANGPGGIGGGGGGAVFGPAPTVPTVPPNPSSLQPTTDDLMGNLIQLIVDENNPNWASNGGVDAISPAATALYISAPPPVHEKVKELLRRLRQSEAFVPIKGGGGK